MEFQTTVLFMMLILGLAILAGGAEHILMDKPLNTTITNNTTLEDVRSWFRD